MHSIWAIATNTIKQAVRMKVAAVFLILLLILLPVMGFSRGRYRWRNTARFMETMKGLERAASVRLSKYITKW